MIQALTELSDIRKTVQDTYEDIRKSISQLSAEVRTLSIVLTLANYTTEFSNNNAIIIQLDYTKLFPQLSPVAELQLLRIAQEALTEELIHAISNVLPRAEW